MPEIKLFELGPTRSARARWALLEAGLPFESIGNDVQIRQNTTLGVKHTVHHFELPRIGDSVDIGAHACILGGVTIGHGAVIGAGAVVLIDVPPNGVAVGVPAKVVKVHSSEQ